MEANKETLEEASSNWFIEQGFNIYNHYDTRPAFIEGAKWQKERMYSEEEVFNLLNFVNDRLPDLYSRFSPEEELEYWFKERKK